jgi:hypothetical protein
MLLPRLSYRYVPVKNIAIFSDFEFDHITPDISEQARASAWELWRDDLDDKQLSKVALLTGANSILYYFGSKVLLTDVQWDEEQKCFLWEVEFDQTS